MQLRFTTGHYVRRGREVLFFPQTQSADDLLFESEHLMRKVATAAEY